MSEFYKKIGVIVGVICALIVGFIAIRTSSDPETGQEIGKALSVLPFSGGILSFLQRILPLNSAMLTITDNKPFIASLLILFVQTTIQSPLMLLLNNTLGPVLFRTNANEYSIVADPNARRVKNKIGTKLGKLFAVCIVVPFIAFLAGYLLQMLFDWVNAQVLPLTILIYILAFAVIIGIALIPVFLSGTRRAFLSFGASALQRIVYVFITNTVIIAVVAELFSGVSGWHFITALLALFFWMTIYSDTDGFLEHRLVRSTRW